MSLRQTLSVAVLTGSAALVNMAYAQTSATLNQVVEKTILNHPEIRARFHDFQSTAEGQAVARGALGPQVNARGWVGREWRNKTEGQDEKNWNRPGYSLELRQLLFDGFSTLNNVRQFGFEKLSGYYELLATTDNLAIESVNAYLDVQRYREMELLARQNFSMHAETLKQLRERQQSGVGRGVDLEQANGRLALAQTNLMTESNNLNDVQQRYRRLTGEYPAAVLADAPSVTGSLPQTPENFLPSLRGNPSILSKQALLKASEFGIDSAKGRFSPTLEFVAATGKDRSQPGEAYRNVQSTSVQLVASMNLYRGGADSARVRQTAAQSYAARDVRDYTCRNVQQELSIAWNNVQRLVAQLPYLREHELATSKVRTAYQQQYQIGQRSLLDLLDTENELFDSRRALVNGIFDLRKAEYRWLALSHQVLPALGLSQPNSEAPEEQRKLELADAEIESCVTPVPDTSNLAPVTVTYQNGTLPPVLAPASGTVPRP